MERWAVIITILLIGAIAFFLIENGVTGLVGQAAFQESPVASGFISLQTPGDSTPSNMTNRDGLECDRMDDLACFAYATAKDRVRKYRWKNTEFLDYSKVKGLAKMAYDECERQRSICKGLEE